MTGMRPLCDLRVAILLVWWLEVPRVRAPMSHWEGVAVLSLSSPLVQDSHRPAHSPGEGIELALTSRTDVTAADAAG